MTIDGLSDEHAAIIRLRAAHYDDLVRRHAKDIMALCDAVAGYAAGRAAGADVPREPTQAMIDAAAKMHVEMATHCRSGPDYPDVWYAMYDAAPRAGAGSTDGRELDAEPIKMPDLRPGPSTHQPAAQYGGPAYCTHGRKFDQRGSECVVRCGLPRAPFPPPSTHQPAPAAGQSDAELIARLTLNVQEQIDDKHRILNEYEAARNLERARAERLAAVLRELVACKDLKERWGAINPVEPGCEKEILRDEYRRRQPMAWAAARNVLAGEDGK